MAGKRRVFEGWLQRRDMVTNMTDTGHRECSETGSSSWEQRLGNDFEGNKKMFWKEVKRVRKGEQERNEMEKDVNGQILRDGVEVRRWAEYFEHEMNVANVKEANINVVGNWRMPVLGDSNERAISLEKVGEAVNEMKSVW